MCLTISLHCWFCSLGHLEGWLALCWTSCSKAPFPSSLSYSYFPKCP